MLTHKYVQYVSSVSVTSIGLNIQQQSDPAADSPHPHSASTIIWITVGHFVMKPLKAVEIQLRGSRKHSFPQMLVPVNGGFKGVP